MIQAANEQWMSEEVYFEHQLSCEGRHDYNNGYLFRVPDEMDTENEIVSACIFLLYNALKNSSYTVYSHSLRIAIPTAPKFYYPDVFITREPRTSLNRYTKYNPELIIEVSSDATFERNVFQKYLDYTSILSLQYYLVVCFPNSYACLYYKATDGKWQEQILEKPDDIISFPSLGIQFPLKEIYG